MKTRIIITDINSLNKAINFYKNALKKTPVDEKLKIHQLKIAIGDLIKLKKYNNKYSTLKSALQHLPKEIKYTLSLIQEANGVIVWDVYFLKKQGSHNERK